jgi:hypothetical protein
MRILQNLLPTGPSSCKRLKLLMTNTDYCSFITEIHYPITYEKCGSGLNAENIKADRPKILRPTHFSCMKDIKADSFLPLTNINANMFKSGE